MSVCQVTLSANAGVALRLGGARIWVDALHQHLVPGFSTVTPELMAAMEAHPDFAAPDLLFSTHRHPDHFSRTLTLRALKRWPLAETVLPEPVLEHQFLLSRPRERLLLPEVTLQFARLPHEGPQYADVPHYGCVLEHEGFRVLIAGDCAVAAPALESFLKEAGPIDLALLDFPWVTLKKGRRFIREVIRPEHLLVYHLPFREDDIYHYRPAAVKAAGLLVEVPDVRLLWEPLQRICVD